MNIKTFIPVNGKYLSLVNNRPILVFPPGQGGLCVETRESEAEVISQVNENVKYMSFTGLPTCVLNDAINVGG